MPARTQRSPHLLLPSRLPGSHLPSPPCIFKPSLLMLRLRHNLRHNQPIPLAIHRHKGQISRRNVPQPLFPHILHHHPNPNLHRSPKSPVHTSLQDQQLPHPHRSHKIQMVHTRRHRKRPRMTASRHRPHQVDILHQPPPKQTPDRIRVRRQHNLTPLRLRLRDRSTDNFLAHTFKSKSPRSPTRLSPLPSSPYQLLSL
jgi:hypothetical protein